MDFRRAEFVRFIEDNELLDDLVDEAKADTWTRAREHAVLLVQAGRNRRNIMVRGGLDGILLEQSSDGKVTIAVDGETLQVLRLGWHVHPRPTGPSDQDRTLLDILGQESSMLYEIGGPIGGTRFTRLSNRSI
jgi:hypothetical protein